MNKPFTQASGNDRPSVPKIIIAANIKGGVGKTTAITLTFNLLELHGCSALVVQLDTQDRLKRTIGRDVIALDTDTLRAARNDPGAGLKAFRPLMEAFERAAASDEIILFDIGASILLVTSGLEPVATEGVLKSVFRLEKKLNAICHTVSLLFS